MIGSKRKIVILSVPDTQEDILKKILKAVEGSADVEEWRMSAEKIERADLQILLPEKMVYCSGKEILLNRHEFDILVYLPVIRAGYGLKNRFMRRSGQRKSQIMRTQLCGALVSFGRNWGIIRKEVLILKLFGV